MISISVGDGTVSFVGVSKGFGSVCVCTTKGALWGRGDMSIDPYRGPGEEEGGGGVVTFSAFFSAGASTGHRQSNLVHSVYLINSTRTRLDEE